MSADSPRRNMGSGGGLLQRGQTVPAFVPPQAVSDRSILDSAIGFINDVTLVHQPVTDPKDTITWARFETCADVSDPRFGDDWELEGNAAPPLLLILGYGLGAQVWAIPANGEAVEVLSWRHGVVTALRVLPTPASAIALDDNGRADEPVDAFAEKRPLVALVDGGNAAASGLLSGNVGGGSGGSSAASAQFSAVNFVSLKTGVQVKTIKFKNAVLDILANRSAIAITFHERIAVFDARTLEDRLTITTCYPSPGINPNPVALGPRWLAYAEHKLLHSKRSGGGCDGEGVPSYTATVLNAAKSFGKGLRELGEQVAAGLTGASAGSGNSSKSSSFDSATGGADVKQSGVVTIIDVKHPVKDYSPTTGTPLGATATHAGSGGDPIIAHFIAHNEALVAMEFDSSGMLLLTADRRGHDFHVFRIQPHPVGASLAAVHHLYVLHRGDTTAKVQHIAFSLDSRWVAVSTLRGTTHVFPITPYGGAMGVRTHTSLHVVNKLSRFHRSAGLGVDGRSSSPISHSESTAFVQSLQPYHNPTLPPFPRPSVVHPLAQLRQPFAMGSPPGAATLGSATVSGAAGVGGGTSQRQRLSSLSDDSGKPLSVCSIFAKSRSWLLEPPTTTREAPHRMQRKAVDSLFVMTGYGALIQYDLDTKSASNVAKEKICDDTPIELEVEPKALWNLGRRKDGSQEIIPPLALDNWLIKDRHTSLLMDSAHHFDEPDERAESWLAQVEITTHAGPHRRLWMGPQFVFKNYNTPSGSNLNHVDAEAVEIGVTKTTTTTLPSTSTLGSGGGGGTSTVERVSPLNMPPLVAPSSVPPVVAARTGVPVLIESGSMEQSPKLMDRFRHGHLDSDYGHGDTRLKEDLADAMRESPSTAAARRETGGQELGNEAASVAGAAAAGATIAITTTATSTQTTHDNIHYYDALTEHYEDQEQEQSDDLSEQHMHDRQERQLLASHVGGTTEFSAMAALASVLPNICSYDQAAKIEKIVNPLGTVTTVTAGLTTEVQTDMLDEVVGQLAAEDCVIHENCDEALFRPVVAIFCDDLAKQRKHEQQLQSQPTKQQEQAAAAAAEHCKPPVVLLNELIVPVIAKEVDDVLTKKEKQKSHQREGKMKSQAAVALALAAAAQQEEAAQAQRFAELSHLNKPSGKAATAVLSSKATRTAEIKTTKTASMNTVATSTTTAKPVGRATASKVGSATTSEDDREATEDELQTSTVSVASTKSAKKAKAAKQKASKAMDRSTSSNMSDSVVMKQLETPAEINAESGGKKNSKKDKKMAAEAKKQAELEETEESETIAKPEEQAAEQQDDEDDYADSLLANKQTIAAVMVSSASAQGLSLHVETSDDEQPKTAKKRADSVEPPKEARPDKEEKAKRPADTEAKNKANKLEAASTKTEELKPAESVQPEQKPTAAMRQKEQAESSKKVASKSTTDHTEDTPKTYTVKVIEEQPTASLSIKRAGKAATTTAAAPAATVSPWKSLDAVQQPAKSVKGSSGAEPISDYPSLSTSPNRKASKPHQVVDMKSELPAADEKLLPSLLTPLKPEELQLPAKQQSPKKQTPTVGGGGGGGGKKATTAAAAASAAAAATTNFDDFLTALKPLEALPPLPALEPLEELAKSMESDADKAIPAKELPLSLINFESPLQENAALERKITPAPRGFTEQNLILALCGSLHYENEYNQLSGETATTPPLYVPKKATKAAAGATAVQKSTSTSNNSSGSEEIIVVEESKKLSKKHKRAKQREQQQAQPDDEELRPLISMSDSQLEVETTTPAAASAAEENHTLPEDLLHFGSSGCTGSSNNLADAVSLGHSSTTTDSEGPVPATTSDDNAVYTLPASLSSCKQKTKKLEHKINLIAAIEAATSSSTSSAEESSVETSAGPSAATSNNKSGDSGVGGNASAGIDMVLGAAAALPLGAAVAAAASATVGANNQPSATKKTTKRPNFFGLDRLDGLAHNNNNNNNNNNSNNNNNNAKIAANKNKGHQKNEANINASADPKPEQEDEADSTQGKPAAAVLPLPVPLPVPAATLAAVGIDGELATVVNIDVFDDQLSISSISTNSRLSLEGPPSQASPPLSLTNGGLIDTNLMHFSESAALGVVSVDTRGDDDDVSSEPPTAAGAHADTNDADMEASAHHNL